VAKVNIAFDLEEAVALFDMADAVVKTFDEDKATPEQKELVEAMAYSRRAIERALRAIGYKPEEGQWTKRMGRRF